MDYSMEELMPVVAWLSEKYTNRESSSISYERANQLMEAVLYSINECCKENDGKQVLEGRRLSAKEAYTRGTELVIEKTKAAGQHYNKIAANFKAYGNRAYRETFLDGIPGFFRIYDVKFNPQDTILTLDYPTLIYLALDSTHKKKCGIDAISDYISYIGLEQDFLQKMPEEFVCQTLREYHPDYEGLFINLAGTVMRRLLQRMIEVSGRQEQFYALSKEELILKLNEFLAALIEKEYGGNQALQQYLSVDLADFAVSILTFGKMQKG